ncbi:hypothetical protein LPTSP3_g35710 [Leptospira kobayashii]|uniref:Outer membrane protein n=1 Tax=Leptospira kobayashii TaxID=1917830 RepID=A0ABM7UNC4_9LEPT|nr:hypothetical protein [Leptospira kobayashii]BDA80641.1 hypothetical protein LPTSP3_g35710 [Leptospira kobayashii]
MRFYIILLLLIAIPVSILQAEGETTITGTATATTTTTAAPSTSSKFAHPIQIEPVAIYTKVRVNAIYWDKKYLGVYEENKNINIEGEYAFTKTLSVTSSLGRNQYSFTDSETEKTWDRWNAGLKYGKVWDNGTSQWLFGAGLRLYDRKRNSELKERENPELYLVRPNIGMGYKNGAFEIMTELRFQTETNSKLKESNIQEFRRYYQLGIAPSFAVTPSLRVFTELEYREPFAKDIDTRTRFFNFYPGVSYATEKAGTFSLSLLFPVLAKNENAIDRGIRFSYIYFFDTTGE